MNTAQKIMAAGIVAILCVGAVYIVFDDDDPPERFRTSWDLVTVDEIADMSSSEALEELQTASDRFVEQASRGTLSPKAMTALLEDLNGTMKETTYALGLFYWDHYRDPTGLSEEYVGWSTFDNLCIDIWDSVLREVLNGPGGDTLRKVIGDEAADALLADESMSEEEIALREMESVILSRYYEATDPDDLATNLQELVDVAQGTDTTATRTTPTRSRTSARSGRTRRRCSRTWSGIPSGTCSRRSARPRGSHGRVRPTPTRGRTSCSPMWRCS